MDRDNTFIHLLITSFMGLFFTGIVTCIPGVTSVEDDPVIRSLDGLRDISATLLSSRVQDNHKPPATKPSDQKANILSTTTDLEGMVELLDKLYALCSVEGSGNASVAKRNGGVELLTSICSALDVKHGRPVVSALKTLSSFLHGMKELFFKVFQFAVCNSSNHCILNCPFNCY